ncbi:GLPGLI family protein [Niabella hirudinis]|uniref:GLPGLI family protein n=1 Tax=Niabella hirudinis TaxID=1285929 RepID=UPI003EBF0B29
MSAKKIFCSFCQAKSLFCIVLLFSYINYLSAQSGESVIQSSQLVVYDLHYLPDSTSKDTLKTIQALLLGKNVSLYGVYGNLNSDTANFYSNRRDGGYINDSKILPEPNSKIKYRISKTKENIITSDRIRVARSPWFRYEESRNIFNWSLKKDTMRVSGVLCQRAECTFGNRKWIAWFAPSIPVSDGPYKFCGLPGLILEVYDDKEYWKFSMVSITNTQYNYPTEAMYATVDKKSAVNVTKKQFMQLLKDSYDNGYEMEKQYGVTPLGDIEKIKKGYADRAKKENNWIEPYSTKK